MLPTENCYVVATDAFSIRGTALLRRAKVQSSGTPLGILVGTTEMVGGIASRVPDRARELMKHFWPGLLTLLLPAQRTLAWDHPAGAPVAVRMPLHPLALAVCQEMGPMAASTATISGGHAPIDPQDAIESLADDVDGLCDVGTLDLTPWSDLEDPLLPSSVVDLTRWPAAISRVGAIPAALLEEALQLAPADTVSEEAHVPDAEIGRAHV